MRTLSSGGASLFLWGVGGVSSGGASLLGGVIGVVWKSFDELRSSRCLSFTNISRHLRSQAVSPCDGFFSHYFSMSRYIVRWCCAVYTFTCTSCSDPNDVSRRKCSQKSTKTITILSCVVFVVDDLLCDRSQLNCV